MAWRVMPLGDLCEVVNGGTPKTGIDEYWGGEHLWITPAEMGKRESPYADDTERKITNAGLQNSSARLLPPHSVILSSRAPIGHLVINTEPMATNQGCKGLVPGPLIDHKYLFYFLGSIVDLLNALGAGATFKELSGGKLKEVLVPVPPLAEQKRIVAILDEAFEGIRIATANAEKNLANARELFESALTQYMDEAEAGGGVLTLADAVAADCSLSYGIVQPGADISDGLPIVRPVDLTGRRMIDLEGLKQIDPKLAAGYARTTLQGGEVLLCVRGTTGVAARAAVNLRGGNVTRGIVPIRFNSDLIDQDFGFYQILSRRVQKQIKKATYGAALMQINIRDLRLVELIAPAKDKQRQIAALGEKVDVEVDRLSDAYNEQVASFGRLRQSILARAFSGQLTATKGLAA